MFRRIRHIIRKEFIQVWHDKKLRFFLIVPPLVQLLAYGYMVNFDIKHVATAILDESRTMESRELIKPLPLQRLVRCQVLPQEPERLAGPHRPR